MKFKSIFATVVLLGALNTASALAGPLEDCSKHISYGAPSASGDILCRLGYVLSHDRKNKTPTWVAYKLEAGDMNGPYERSDDFRPDTDLSATGRSELNDYKGSGYDRGHMAPAAAFKWSKRAMSESFLLSNMAPQVGSGFNQHIWRNLESMVRDWVRERGSLYVVTGNIYATSTPKTIGDNKVAVPTHCYKVIFDPISVTAIAFILPNKKLKSSDLPNFITTVDDVEDKTGLDFLSNLDDQIEAKVESTLQPLW